ncbi:unnamed protein product [Cyprideis torosa]|uniref:Uncharacterized protein n=1 Tax=Cyprideis torosa TaxID=163714 RepID=A0A7R8WHS8_9CRUS|nr:unnamed protein product [Cyprideis torosa]CAG0899780.1 unnamed protein product [Cyprideis torosa]
MWLKFFLFVVYLVLLFLISRVLEVWDWYGSGLWSSSQLVPSSLGVRDLKSVLDYRSVEYWTAIEKTDLVAYVEKSGNLTTGELIAASASLVPNDSIAISSEAQYLEIERSKDSVYLVQVIPRHRGKGPLLDTVSWHQLIRKLLPAGIQPAILDCSVEPRLCRRKGWDDPMLLLFFPHGAREKAVVRATTLSRIRPLMEWIRRELSAGIVELSEVTLSQWTNSSWGGGTRSAYPTGLTPILQPPSQAYPPLTSHRHTFRAIYISRLLVPPLFLAVLSRRFSGQIKIGFFHDPTVDAKPSPLSVGGCGKISSGFDDNDGVSANHTSSSESDPEELDKQISPLAVSTSPKRHASNTRLFPSFLVITPETSYCYGHRFGEHMAYHPLELFFRTLHPSPNDFFILSLLIVNLMLCLDAFVFHGRRFWRLAGKIVWNLLSSNVAFSLIWLLPWEEGQGKLLLSVWIPGLPLSQVMSRLRLSALSSWASKLAILRSDLLFWSEHCSLLLVSFLLFGLLVFVLRLYLYGIEDLPGEEDVEDVTSGLVDPAMLRNSSNGAATSDIPQSAFQASGLPGSSGGLGDVLSGYLFRPIASLSQTRLPTDSEIEDGLEMVIQGLAMPNLWLQPPRRIKTDYLKQLPLWRYRLPPPSSVTSESDDASDARSMFALMSSTGEDEDNDLLLRRRRGGPSRRPPTPEAASPDCSCASSASSRTRWSDRCHKWLGQCHRYLWGEGRGRDENSTSACKRDPSPPPGMLLCSDCAICLERYIPDDLLCGLPCGHSYHRDCVFSWLESRSHPNCPTCRWPAHKKKKIAG